MSTNADRQQTRHHCRRRHLDYLAFARCAWPEAAWIEGEGRWASVAHCRDLTVMLHKSLDDARAAVAAIDRRACGGACSRHHEVVELVIPAARPQSSTVHPRPAGLAAPVLVAGVR